MACVFPTVRDEAVSSRPQRFPTPEVTMPSSPLFASTLGALALAASPGGRERITLLPAPLIPTPGR